MVEFQAETFYLSGWSCQQRRRRRVWRGAWRRPARAGAWTLGSRRGRGGAVRGGTAPTAGISLITHPWHIFTMKRIISSSSLVPKSKEFWKIFLPREKQQTKDLLLNREMFSVSRWDGGQSKVDEWRLKTCPSVPLRKTLTLLCSCQDLRTPPGHAGGITYRLLYGSITSLYSAMSVLKCGGQFWRQTGFSTDLHLHCWS